MNLMEQNCFLPRMFLFSSVLNLFVNNKLYLICYLGCILQLLHGDEAALPSMLLHNCFCIPQIEHETT